MACVVDFIRGVAKSLGSCFCCSACFLGLVWIYDSEMPAQYTYWGLLQLVYSIVPSLISTGMTGYCLGLFVSRDALPSWQEKLTGMAGYCLGLFVSRDALPSWQGTAWACLLRVCFTIAWFLFTVCPSCVGSSVFSVFLCKHLYPFLQLLLNSHYTFAICHREEAGWGQPHQGEVPR